MSELREVLERADRAVARIPLPLDGFQDLERYRARRRRTGRILALATALLVAGGSLGALRCSARSIGRPARSIPRPSRRARIRAPTPLPRSPRAGSRSEWWTGGWPSGWGRSGSV